MSERQAALDFDLNADDPAFIQNPHPTLKRLREHDPVHWNPDGSVYLTRYEDVQQVYQDRTMISDKTEPFAEKFGDGSLYTHHTTSLVFNDPPYHTTVRKLLASAFTPRKLAEMEPLIGQIVDDLLDDLLDHDEVEFVSAFAMRLPTEVISFMLGVPKEHRSKLRGYSLAILGALDPVVSQAGMQKGNHAVDEFGAMLGELIDHRRKNPEGAGQGEVLEALIFGEFEGRRLSQKELIQNCIFLLNAGHETTTSLMANGVGMFLDHPDQYRLLIEQPDLVSSAVEEILRYESPLQIGNRVASRDVEFSGGLVPKGTYIHTSIASANRDERIFGNADKVDFTRKPNRHIAFITGIHVCLGATLARYEGKIAFGRLLQRFPNMEPAGVAVRMPLARFRGYTSLPVRLGQR
ncbi:MAG: cytochrome P450 [Rhizobiaceae bacterium]|nr:cytochrome P450 [Hyphomicrobiales bacterium]NRB29006.1 cytochrome P450 [Rhizobiaceae bacterium]